MKPFSPRPGKGWVKIDEPYVPTSKNAEGWHHPKKKILVLSSVDPSGTDDAEEYHLSISTARGRCNATEAMRTLHEFGMDNANEDNSGSKMPHVRHFWKIVGKEKS